MTLNHIVITASSFHFHKWSGRRKPPPYGDDTCSDCFFLKYKELEMIALPGVIVAVIGTCISMSASYSSSVRLSCA